MTDQETHGKPTVPMRISVPVNVYKYLGFLAQTTNMGGTENDVALFILQTATEEMRDNPRYRMIFSGGP